MRQISKLLLGLFGIGFLSLVIGVSTQTGILINGAGATFPFPLYSKWFYRFYQLHPKIQLNYQSIGSGGGIRQFTENTVDFGATDVPMTDQQLAKSAKPILHIPTVAGAVVLTYHLADVPTRLKLSPEIIADLFLGKIETWDDVRIRELNRGVPIPHLPVIIVHRSDGSGTTSVFTHYLSQISSEWKSRVGAGTAVNWPAGLGGKGNEGVSGLIKQTPGSIGYTELIYAEKTHLSYASVKNPLGEYITPSLQSVTAAASGIIRTMPKDFRVALLESPQKGAYPICSFTYLLVYQTMNREKGEPLIQFLNWAITEGQKDAPALYYAPLPQALVQLVKKSIDTIILNSGSF